MADDWREDLANQLPERHAQALQLLHAGVPLDEIAARLDVEPEAVRPLLAIARAKLAALDARDEGEQP